MWTSSTTDSSSAGLATWLDSQTGGETAWARGSYASATHTGSNGVSPSTVIRATSADSVSGDGNSLSRNSVAPSGGKRLGKRRLGKKRPKKELNGENACETKAFVYSHFWDNGVFQFCGAVVQFFNFNFILVLAQLRSTHRLRRPPVRCERDGLLT